MEYQTTRAYAYGVFIQAWEEHEQIKIGKSIEKEQREKRQQKEMQKRKERIDARIEAEYAQPLSSSSAKDVEHDEDDPSEASSPMAGGFLDPDDADEAEY